MEKIDSGEILRQLRAIATADVTKVVQIENGQLTVRNSEQLPEDIKLAVCAVEKNTSGVQVKFYDKLKALELLGKAMGLFIENQKPNSGGNSLLRDVLRNTKEEMDIHELPELQQATAAGYDLVESTGTV